MYNLMTAAAAAASSSQWQAGAALTHSRMLHTSETVEEKEATSLSHVLPCFISSGSTDDLMALDSRQLPGVYLQPPETKAAARVFFILQLYSAHGISLFWWKQWNYVGGGEDVWSVFFNRLGCYLSGSSSTADTPVSLGGAAPWIIALNTSSTEGGYNKAALYCCL